MNIVRGFTLAVVAVLGTGLLQAQSGVGPITPNFNIGIDGWDPFQSFTASTNTDNNDNEFIPGETGTCVNGGLPPTCDPLIHFNVGGDPIGVGSTFGFSADDDGGGSFDFVNDGPPILNTLITTQLTSDQFSKVFTCSSNEFSFCGFSDSGSTLEIFFNTPIAPEGIPSAVPEPKSYALLLIAFAALFAAHKIRSHRGIGTRACGPFSLSA